MLATLVASSLVPQPWVLGYHPTGPKIKVAMSSGRSFVIQTDPKGSPKTVARILQLVRRGFYNGQRFHRVESWVVQWGDPISKKGLNQPGIGEGGSGWRLPFEERPDVDFSRGVVGVASDGLQNGGDSQLFILKTDRFYLYRSYAVVGKVVQGMNVVGTIEKGDRIRAMTVLGSMRRARR